MRRGIRHRSWVFRGVAATGALGLAALFVLGAAGRQTANACTLARAGAQLSDDEVRPGESVVVTGGPFTVKRPDHERAVGLPEDLTVIAATRTAPERGLDQAQVDGDPVQELIDLIGGLLDGESPGTTTTSTTAPSSTTTTLEVVDTCEGLLPRDPATGIAIGLRFGDQGEVRPVATVDADERSQLEHTITVPQDAPAGPAAVIVDAPSPLSSTIELPLTILPTADVRGASTSDELPTTGAAGLLGLGILVGGGGLTLRRALRRV